MPDRSAFHTCDDLTRHTQNCLMAESGHCGAAAVASCKFHIFFISTKFQCFLDHRGKIFVLTNVDHARISYYFRCKYPVRITVLYRHQTVCRIKNRCRNVCKLLLLILPCGSKVSFQMRIFPKHRICMSRQHLAVGVNLDSQIFRLFQ